MPLLSVERLTKAYGEITVLTDVTFDVPCNSVVSLVGENGAGKSTLFNILSGLVRPDSGTMTLHAADYTPTSYVEAWKRGVSRVFQEQSLVLNVPVYENIVLGQEARFRKAGLVNHGAMIRVAQRVIDDAGLDVDVRRLTSSYDFSRRQAIEIARACLGPVHIANAEQPLILLDEPTSALDRRDEEAFYMLVHRLKQTGSMIFVSHRMAEVLELSDHIHVLRDGTLVASFTADEATNCKLHENMVGRERAHDFYHESRQRDVNDEREILSVDGLCGPNYENVTFKLRTGEIVGIGGLLDSGKSELGKGIAGVVTPEEGTVRMFQRDPHKPVISDSVKNGLGYVPAERLAEGMIPSQSVAWNISLGSGEDRASNWFGLWRNNWENTVAQKFIRSLRIKSSVPDTICARLSGGNQQKVVLARWLCREPGILILDNPTRGVDAGAKEEIYQVIRDLADRGVGIVLITDELLELIGLSNQVLIMQRGRVVARIDSSPERKPTETELVSLMMPADDTRQGDYEQRRKSA